METLPALRREEHLVLRISELRDQLDTVVSIGELNEANLRLSAVDAYAKASGAKEITDRATEARVWVERRAGELALEQCLSPKDLQQSFGVKQTAALRWRLFAAVESADLEALISEIRSTRDLTLTGVVAAIRSREESTSTPGVFRLPDGSYRLRWSAAGLNHVLHCRPGTKLSDARGRLARAKRQSYGRVNKPGANGLSVAYGQIRSLLSALDGMLPELTPDARALVEQAMNALHTAEDSVSSARRLV